MAEKIVRIALVDRKKLNEKDNKGLPKFNEVKQPEIFAEMEDVRQSEYYSAMQDDIELSAMFIVWEFEYHGEKELELEGGKRMKIERTHEKPGTDKLELVCSDKGAQKYGFEGSG